MVVQRLLCVCCVTAVLVFTVALGQPCTLGFPSTVSQCTSGCNDGPNQPVTRIIPDMNFTCNGTVTHWRAAGFFNTMGNRNTDAVLGIWRETSDGSGTYERMGRIQLGTCEGQPLAHSTNDVYECTLPQNERVTVQPGDVIGIETSENNDYRFRLYFTTGGGPTNYQFSGHDSWATLSASTTVQDQPQISLTVEPIMSTTVQPPTTTTETTAVTTETQSSTTDGAQSIAMAVATTTTTEPQSTTTEIRPTITAQATTTPIENVPTTAENSGASATTKAVATYDTPSTFRSTATDNFVPDSHTEILDENSNSVEVGNSNANLGLLVGSVVGGVVGIILLTAVAILILIVVYQSRKCTKVTRDREARTAIPQNFSTLNGIETKANLSYIPVFHLISMGDNVAYGDQISTEDNVAYGDQISTEDNVAYGDQISTEDNVAYGEMVNQDSNGLYETIY